MKILYLLKQDPDPTGKKLMEAHKKGNDVTVVKLQENKDYGKIVDLIFSTDKIISW